MARYSEEFTSTALKAGQYDAVLRLKNLTRVLADGWFVKPFDSLVICGCEHLLPLQHTLLDTVAACGAQVTWAADTHSENQDEPISTILAAFAAGVTSFHPNDADHSISILRTRSDSLSTC